MASELLERAFPVNAYNKNPVFKACAAIYRVYIKKEVFPI
jgi:hypothetical protein